MHGKFKVFAASAAAAVVVLSGCTSSTSGSAPTNAPTTATTTSTPSGTVTPPVETTPSQPSKITFGTPIAAVAAGMGCVDPQEPEETAGDSLNLGFKPEAEVECTLDGQLVSLVTLTDTAQLNAMIAVTKELAESFQVEVYLVVGEGWIAAAVDSEDTDSGPEVSKATADKIVSRLGGVVQHHGGK